MMPTICSGMPGQGGLRVCVTTPCASHLHDQLSVDNHVGHRHQMAL